MGASTLRERRSIQFGDGFELDVRALELLHSGRPLRLERIPTQILLILIEQQGQLVSREEIAEQIWGKHAFLDTDNGINGAIRKIRQVLNDDPLAPRFVQTVTGRGYRFVAPVSGEISQQPTSEKDEFKSAKESGTAPGAPTSPQILDNSNTAGTSTEVVASYLDKRHLISAAAVLFCFLIGFAGWSLRSSHDGSASAHSLRSIAVLPLQNLSGDPSQDYFADGMTEELITELSRIQSLRVVSHTSVMEYKGTRKHLPQIAKELGVDLILEGSVIRENDQVRVTVQLLDAPNDRHIWSDEYERPLHGVLNLQREVGEAVTREIRIKLTPEQEARFNAARDVAPEAYEAYLKGRYHLWNDFTLGQPQVQAKKDFEEALRKDPSFALAYSGLADAHVYLALYRMEPEEVAFPAAKEAIRKATELDGSIGETHDTMGLMMWRHELDWSGADREFNKAIELSPSYSCAHEDRAEFLAITGRRAEALAEVATSRELDLGPSAATTEEDVLYQLRDYEGLVKKSRRGVLANPNSWSEHFKLGIGYEGTGKMLEAISEYESAVELSHGDQDVAASLAHAFAVVGKGAEAERILRDLEQQSKSGYVSPYLMATIYAGLGEKDAAFRLLEKAYAQRNLELSWHLKADVRIDNLRSDPRFIDLERRIGLPLKVDIAAAKPLDAALNRP